MLLAIFAPSWCTVPTCRYPRVNGATEPYQGVQNQRFRVTVTISDETSPGSGVLKAAGSRPVQEKILWTTLGIVQPRTLRDQVDWVMLVDRPFTLRPL